ncbi:phage tail fiber domain-containing protein [Enterobacter kobei]|uniref:phage tail fiber domain-containing protein n=1 Tax=Enterobacter kobei TaxID=208224 RepID=UPI00298C4FCB|nr:phage tail fiber protein [Enterobacter kobei]
MSVPNQTPYIIYNANGLTTVFPFEFYIINAGDIQVSINGTVVTSGYSVSGTGNVGGGDVTFITPPASGSVVMLERVVPTYRLTDYQDNGDLLADTVNKDFDRLWMAIQRSFIYLGLALRRPLLGGPFNAEGYRIAGLANPVDAQDAATKNYVDNVSLVRALRVPESSVGILPPADQRANKLLAFNALGQPITVVPQSGSASDVLIELAKPTGASLIGVQPQGNLADMQFYVTPEQFGDYIDEDTNFTSAVQAAIDYAAANPGVFVRGRDKTYGVGKLNVTVGVKMIKSLKLRCVVDSTDIVLGSLVDSGHEDLVIDGVSIDANSNVTKASILMSGMRRSTIKNCRVFGNKVHGDLYGIRIGVLSSTSVNEQNKILNNHVVMPVDPDNGLGSDAMVGISLTGIPSSTYGGLDINGGNPLWPSILTIKDTVVSGNYIEGGTHGFAGGAVFRARITNNQMISNSHRNINLSGNCQRCLVANNHLLEGGSSAVNVAWGSRWMMVHNNYIQSAAAGTFSTDDAAIQMYKAVDSCSIVGNIILGSWKYSVYLGSMVTNITLSGNSFNAGSLANVAIESDWVNTSTYPLAIYSRNYNPTTVPVSGDSGNINIGGNTYTGASCAIYQVAVNGKALYNVNIHDELVGNAPSMNHVTYSYDAGTIMTDGVLSNIAARGATAAKHYLSRGRGAFSFIKNVTALDDGTEVSVSGATPSAVYGPNLYIASGTITNFTGAQRSDIINVRMADGVVLVHNSSIMRLKGSTNATASGGAAVITLQLRAGIWFEICRNF